MKPAVPAKIARDPTIMRPLGPYLVGVALLLGIGSHARGAEGSRKVEVQDPQYHMTAYTLELPSGWRFGGTIVRDTRPCHGGGPELKSTMQGPDGTSAVIFLPGGAWNWTADPAAFYSLVKVGCLPSDLATAATFLTHVALPILQPNARIVSVQPLTPAGQQSLAQQLQQEQQGAERFTRAGFRPPRNTIDGARVRVEYTRNGKVVEEQLQSIIDCVETQAIPMPRQPVYMERRCKARNIYIVRAPKGQLDALLASPLLEKLNSSIQSNSQWTQQVGDDQSAQVSRMLQESNKVLAGSRAASAQQFQQLVQQGKAFQQQQQESFEAAQANARANEVAGAKAADDQVNLSLAQAKFTDPNTGQTILASNAYAHQWLSSDNSTLIQTQNPFDPNRTVEPALTNPASVTWTELTLDR